MQEINKKKKNIINVFLKEFIRIKGVLNWSIVSFIGFLLGMSSLNISKYIVPLEVFIIFTFCILSFTFAINNHYDATSDRENPIKRRINAIASGRISKQTSLPICEIVENEEGLYIPNIIMNRIKNNGCIKASIN